MNTLPKVLDSEFRRVAKEEGRGMAELVGDLAALCAASPRQLYNWRSGKWSPPARTIPILCARFKSPALLHALACDAAAMEVVVPDGYDLAHLMLSSLRLMVSHHERYLLAFDSKRMSQDDVEQIKNSGSEIIRAVLTLNGIVESAYVRQQQQRKEASR